MAKPKEEVADHRGLNPIEGCVVNWEMHVQVNPETGEHFEWDGTKIFDNDLGRTETKQPTKKKENP